MTELNDHIKLMYARAAQLYCRGCGEAVRRDTPDSVYADVERRAAEAGDPRLEITFPVAIPQNFSKTEVRSLLEQQGYTRIRERAGKSLEVVQDRLRMGNADNAGTN